jgi:hypothetical protein
MLLLPLVLLALSSCTAPLNAAKPAAPASSATSAGGTPTASPAATQAGRPYSSTSFVVPFDITLPSWVPSGPPTKANRNFVTWVKEPDPDRRTVALRVMHPGAVFRPFQSLPSSVPADYVGYLRSLASAGTNVTDETKVKAGPYPATLFTLTTFNPQDGSVGCPMDHPTDPGKQCFAAQPGLAIRMAVLTVHKTLLLFWMRTSQETHDLAADSPSFATMIEGLRFPDRAVTAVKG